MRSLPNKSLHGRAERLSYQTQGHTKATDTGQLEERTRAGILRQYSIRYFILLVFHLAFQSVKIPHT